MFFSQSHHYFPSVSHGIVYLQKVTDSSSHGIQLQGMPPHRCPPAPHLNGLCNLGSLCCMQVSTLRALKAVQRADGRGAAAARARGGLGDHHRLGQPWHRRHQHL